MSNDKGIEAERTPRSGAEWYVRLDGDVANDATEAEFAAWLDSDPAHEAEFARCEAAVQLVTLLNDDKELQWALDEAAQIAGKSVPLHDAVRGVPWYQQPLLAWSVAGVFVVIAAFTLIERYAADLAPQHITALPPPKENSSLTLAVAEPAVVLPGEISVDARSVAVLPFVSAKGADDGAATSGLAATLHEGESI